MDAFTARKALLPETARERAQREHETRDGHRDCRRRRDRLGNAGPLTLDPSGMQNVADPSVNYHTFCRMTGMSAKAGRVSYFMFGGRTPSSCRSLRRRLRTARRAPSGVSMRAARGTKAGGCPAIRDPLARACSAMQWLAILVCAAARPGRYVHQCPTAFQPFRFRPPSPWPGCCSDQVCWLPVDAALPLLVLVSAGEMCGGRIRPASSLSTCSRTGPAKCGTRWSASCWRAAGRPSSAPSLSVRGMGWEAPPISSR